jgi:hypothetical protein
MGLRHLLAEHASHFCTFYSPLGTRKKVFADSE